MNTIAIHKSFDKSGMDGKRASRLWVYDGKEIDILEGNKKDAFLLSLRPGQVVKVTQVNATDMDLLALSDRGVDIRYAHWHSLGFEKGMEPASIVSQYFEAPDDLFRSFIGRPDIAKLRQTLSLRNSLAQCYGDALRRVKQFGRNVNIPDASELRADEMFNCAMEGIKGIKAAIVSENGKNLETEVANLAKKIPECVLFNKVAHLDSWILAASFVSVSGGFDRFDGVASVWHYYGMHVVDGKAPKRTKGAPMSWSPEGRKACYLLGDVIIKATDHGGARIANPWRKVFDEYREIERAKHDDVCKCEYRDGHSTARARRKVVKSILKRFYLATQGETYDEDHNPIA